MRTPDAYDSPTSKKVHLNYHRFVHGRRYPIMTLNTFQSCRARCHHPACCTLFLQQLVLCPCWSLLPPCTGALQAATAMWHERLKKLFLKRALVQVRVGSSQRGTTYLPPEPSWGDPYSIWCGPGVPQAMNPRLCTPRLCTPRLCAACSAPRRSNRSEQRSRGALPSPGACRVGYDGAGVV